MITLQTIGSYKLCQTKKQHTKILYLDEDSYVWVRFEKIGEILVKARGDHATEFTLSSGQYRIYSVEDEPQLNDNLHLELQVGTNNWQGYLLLTGLPTEHRTRTRIIATDELITGNSLFSNRNELLMSLSNVE